MKNDADFEIEKLKALQRTLVGKNMAGIFSDEVFKEQHAILEEKIIKEHVVKEDSTLDKYNIDEVTSFIKTMLSDLGESYKRSNLSQAKVMLGLIFPKGLYWDFNGGMNHEISPIYQAIHTINPNNVSQCGR